MTVGSAAVLKSRRERRIGEDDVARPRKVISSGPKIGGGTAVGPSVGTGVAEPMAASLTLGCTDAEMVGEGLGMPATPSGPMKMSASSTTTIPVSASSRPISQGTACSAVVGRRRSPSRRGSQSSGSPSGSPSGSTVASPRDVVGSADSVSGLGSSAAGSASGSGCHLRLRPGLALGSGCHGLRLGSGLPGSGSRLGLGLGLDVGIRRRPVVADSPPIGVAIGVELAIRPARALVAEVAAHRRSLRLVTTLTT